MTSQTIFGSSKDQAARTPPCLLKYIERRFGELKDMAPVNPTHDSLAAATRFAPRNYINPPFNDVERWLEKAISEQLLYGCATLFLIPFRPHTVYYKRLCGRFSFVELLSSGVTFVPYDRPIPHAICFVGIGLPNPKPVVHARGVVQLTAYHDFERTPTRRTPAVFCKKLNKVFGVDCAMLTSVKDLPASDFVCPLSQSAVRHLKLHLMSDLVFVIPLVLYKDDGKRNFLGSVAVLRSTTPVASALKANQLAAFDQLFSNNEYAPAVEKKKSV